MSIGIVFGLLIWVFSFGARVYVALLFGEFGLVWCLGLFILVWCLVF